MTAATEPGSPPALGAFSKRWWIFLVTGIAWVILSIVFLSFDPGTPALIGLFVGILLIAAGINELVAIAFVDSWRWLHALLGVLFLVTGIMSLTKPLQTFGILALFLGWYLVFKGTADIIMSIVERDALHLWGLLLASGIIELAIGVWAIGYPGRSAWLLVVWIGISALMRGVTEIVFAFKLRSVPPAGPAPFALA
jgi:uncharacterized membrane protein HdeD (DUF308 family)